MANAGRRQQVDAAREREEGELRLALADLAQVMADPVGRRFVMRLLQSTGVEGEGRFVPNAMEMAHAHGVRSVGLGLLVDIRETCPEAEFLMRQEYAARERRARLDEESNDAS
jgi:hypothetical protein